MIEKLKNAVMQGQKIGRAIQFDPAQFNDPIATKTEWMTMNNSSSNFRTHNLKEDEGGILAFKPSLGSKIFSLVFVFSGLIFPFIFFSSTYNSDDPEAFKVLIFMTLFSAVFIGVGFYLFRKNSVVIAFDKNRGIFWKGKMNPENSGGDTSQNLSNIHAVQLLSRLERSDKKSYFVFETIAVLKNADRRLLVSQGGSRSKAVTDAQNLAAYLNVPFWDAS
jgi:hypothetical protein